MPIELALVIGLCIVSVVAVASTVTVAIIMSKLSATTLRHVEDMMQIGGTPVGMARAQTEYEMKRAEAHAAEQKRIADELKAVANGSAASGATTVKEIFG